MKASMLKINPVFPQQRLVEKAVAALRDGGLIAYPTDTAYGIGADLFNKKAIERIYLLKPQKKKKMMAFICHDLKDISQYAIISDNAYRLMKKHIPGPFTFVLYATREVPKLVMTKRNTVGIRVPDNNICQAIVKELGNPIITTTATFPGNDDVVSDPYDIYEKLGHALDYVIDCGPLPADLSTIVDLSGTGPEIIRKGKGDTSFFE